MTSESSIMQHFLKVSIKFCSGYGNNISDEENRECFGLPNWISGQVKATPALR